MTSIENDLKLLELYCRAIKKTTGDDLFLRAVLRLKEYIENIEKKEVKK